MIDAKRLILPLAASVSLVALAACGGSDGGSTTTPEVAETVAEATTEAATDAAEATTEAVTEVAEVVETAADDAADAAQEVAADLQDAASDAAAEVEETVAQAVSETSDRVSDEITAAYAALTGDAAQGRRVFTKCMACHVVQEGQNRVGPSLYGLVGREAGSIENFRYSQANANSGIVWTEPVLFAYLENPRGFLPGTNMAFPGLPSEQERADVIAYIKAESE
ncbi:MAG: cytochrome c family protein [Pseudomonadota bacterium]